MPITCPNCHTPNRLGAKFCQSCGATLPTSPAPVAGTQPMGASQPSGSGNAPSGSGSTPPGPEPHGPGRGQPNKPALQPGMILQSRYRIENVLGVGGFGAVYRAWDANLNRWCAVKENLETSADAQRQFTREATILANLSHPNLPRVTDHFSIPGQGQYLVMDYVEGEDLESLVQRVGKTPPEQALKWITQVTEALAYLHSQTPPIVHRDIKPANIRVTPAGKAMLVDFGLVKVYDPHLRTTVGARAVTPGFSPPEQYGQGSTDPRTDVYALGATLYTLLTGSEPPESVQRVALDNLLLVHQLNPQVSPLVSTVIAQAMSLSPSQRYKSAVEFKKALTASPGATPTIAAQPVAPVTIAAPTVAAPTSEVALPAPSPRFQWTSATIAFAIVGCIGVIALAALLWPKVKDMLPATRTETDTPVVMHTRQPRADTDTPPPPPGEITLTPSPTQPVAGLLTDTPTKMRQNPVTSTPSPTPPPKPPTYTPSSPPPLDTDMGSIPGYDLAFASDRDGNIRIYLMDSNNPSNWTGLPVPSGYNRSWWPSFCGASIASEVQDVSGSTSQWIYLLDSSGGSSRWNPPGSPSMLGVPRCSPGGRYMAYSTRKEGAWGFELIDLSNNRLVSKFTRSILGYASWSTVNDNLFTMVSAGAQWVVNETSNTLDSATSSTRQIISNAKYPAISPDGRQLAYVCNGVLDLCVKDLSSGQVNTLLTLNYEKVAGKPAPASAMWSADGQWIYFASVDGGDWDIFRIRPDGSGLQNMTADWSSNELMPALQW